MQIQNLRDMFSSEKQKVSSKGRYSSNGTCGSDPALHSQTDRRPVGTVLRANFWGEESHRASPRSRLCSSGAIFVAMDAPLLEQQSTALVSPACDFSIGHRRSGPQGLPDRSVGVLLWPPINTRANCSAAIDKRQSSDTQAHPAISLIRATWLTRGRFLATTRRVKTRNSVHASGNRQTSDPFGRLRKRTGHSDSSHDDFGSSRHSARLSLAERPRDELHVRSKLPRRGSKAIVWYLPGDGGEGTVGAVSVMTTTAGEKQPKLPRLERTVG